MKWKNFIPIIVKMSHKPIRFKSPARSKANQKNKSADPNTTLEKAVKTNELNKVKEAMKKDSSNICGTVKIAVTNGKSIEIIRYLLECEKDDLMDETRLMALNAAVKAGHEQLVKELLDDIEQRMMEVIDDSDLLDDLFDDFDEAVYTASLCPNKNILKLIEDKLAHMERAYYGDSEEGDAEGAGSSEEDSDEEGGDDDSEEESEGDSEEEESEDDESEEEESEEEAEGGSDDDEATEEAEESDDEESEEESEMEKKGVETKGKVNKK